MRTISWKIHLNSPPETVFDFISTPKGRSKFWAEEANQEGGVIHFRFPSGITYDGQVLKSEPNREFVIDYFDCEVIFKLESAEGGGTDLSLTSEVPDEMYEEVNAGWVSVLMSLKAAADYGIDLRNHDPTRTWDQGFADN